MANPYESPESTSSNFNEIDEIIAPQLKSIRIVAATIIQGAVIIWLIALFLGGFAWNAQPEFLSYVMLSLSGLLALLHWVIPRIIERNSLQRLAADSTILEHRQRGEKVLTILRASHVIQLAMLESGSVLNAVAYMIQPWSGSVIAGFVILILMLIQFPTRTSLGFKLQNILADS